MTHYPESPGYKAWGTSQEAALKIELTAKTIRGDVLRLLRSIYPRGLSADRIATRLDLSILTVRPRVSELSNMGLVEKTGDRVRNASGMDAWVWRATVQQELPL